MNLAKTTDSHLRSVHGDSASAFRIRNFTKKGYKPKKRNELHATASFSPDPNQNRRAEIMSFSNDLKAFGISFSILSQKSPRKRDDRQKAFDLAKLLERNVELKKMFLTKKRLPMEGLTEQTDVTKDFLKNYQSYITAVSLLLIGGYTSLLFFLEGGIH